MGQTNKQTHPSLSRLRKVGMCCLWIVVAPVILFLLLCIAIYIPPVQQWAVGKACTALSEEMGMDVRVESVRLSFPLDLRMDGMTAVQDGDTLVKAESLNVSMKLWPLFRGKVEVDDITLKNTHLNTKQLIEACAVNGYVGKISLESHSTDIVAQRAVVNHLLVSDADLCIVLRDSVPEDTTESGPVDWTVQLDDIQLQRIRANVVLSDSSSYDAVIASTSAKAFLDLGKSVYDAEVKAQDIDFKVFNGLNVPNGLNAPAFQFPQITDLSAIVAMDSLSLDLKSLKAKTASSELALAFRMDMNAFDSISPGTFSALAEGSVGKADIAYFLEDNQAIEKQETSAVDFLPELPSTLKIKADGNLNELSVSDLQVVVPGIVTLDGDATAWNVTDNLSLQTNLTALLAGNGSVKATAEMAMGSETYSANVDFRNVDVNKLMQFAKSQPLSEQLMLDGAIDAHGQGFDIQDKKSVCKTNVRLGDSRFGKFDLSNINADANIQNGLVGLALDCDNSQLVTAFNYTGEIDQQHIAGLLDIELRKADFHAMGIAEKPFSLATTGKFDISYDFATVFRVESNVEPLHLCFEKDTVKTRPFYLLADAQRNATDVCFKAGDLDLDFSTPHNFFALSPKFDKLIAAAAKQQKTKEFDISTLRPLMPELHLHIAAERGNPLAQFLKMQGVQFDELAADINTSPLTGIDASGYVSQLCKDSLSLDHAEFNINQDTTVLKYRVLATRFDTHPLPAFYAMLEGYLGMKDADVHLLYHDMDGHTGFDIGLHAIGTDSCHHIVLYPAQPTLAFQRYDMNEDNFVCLRRGGKPVYADVRLQSVDSNASLSLVAAPNEHGEQDATAVLTDIDVERLLAGLPLPDMPSVKGLMSGNATYSVENGAFTVNGRARVKQFAYEGMDVGQVGCRFAYTPQGETAHDISLSLACDSIQVGDLQGVYDAAGKGSLTAHANIYNVPLAMASPFIPDQMAQLTGSLTGAFDVAGPVDRLLFNGAIVPKDVHALSPQYSVDLALANDSIRIADSRLAFDRYRIYSYDDNPLTLNGFVDFADIEKMNMSLNLTGNKFKLIESKRAPKKVLFGNLYGDVNARLSGTLRDLTMRGRVTVLKSSDMTYIMSETPLSQGDRLDDIVTFVDFRAPADTTVVEEKKTFMGVNMNLNLAIEDGAKVRAELSPDRQSYVDVQGGGSLRMTLTPEGVMSMTGRYTINEGEMKYSLPVIPLRTFTIHSGSYIEFTGDMMNPSMNITATERTRSSVSEADGSSRTVSFDAGVRLSNTLSNMGLEFIIDAPDDQNVQSELATMGTEERNKLAVAMLATNMYLASGNGGNLTATNALNTFLQSEINNIAGKAFNSLVNVDVGMEQNTTAAGATRTDYSFKFSRRFFSDRLNVVVGGKVSSAEGSTPGESGTHIDDISVEWRLDNGGTQYVRIFHEKDYTNLIEGDLDKNGAGILLRKKVERLSDLFFWRRKREQ